MKPTILVTGATGKTGAVVATLLREQGWPVRALIHRRDERSERLDRLGIETVVADMFDPEQLVRAIRGTTRAYFVPISRPFMIQAATAFAVAARDAGLEAIVQMSQWTSNPSHPSLLTRQTWLVDRMFSMIPGIAHIILNPGMFADNYLRVVDFASLLGVFPILTGDSRSAPVSNEDIGRVAVELLKNPARFEGKSYRPTGPTLLSGNEMAAVIQNILGRRVLPFHLPTWMFLKVARMQGVDQFEISGLMDYLIDHRKGVFEFERGVNDVVLEVTGKPAEDFETTARRYLALPFAQRTWQNRLRAIANFSVTPFFPGYDLKRFERDHDFPKPSSPSLSIESERWREEHRTGGRLGTSTWPVGAAH